MIAMFLKRTVCNSLIMLTLMFSTAVHSAELIDAGKIKQRINLFGTVVFYPPPSWIVDKIVSSELLKMSEVSRKSNERVFIHEQIPKGDSFDSWNRMYAVFAIDTQSQKLPLKGFVNQSLATFVQICSKDNIAIQVLKESADIIVMIVMCRDSVNSNGQHGYKPGVGEVAVFYFAQSPTTTFKIYQEWRGQSFDIKKPDTWPVSKAELKMMVDRFQSISFKDAE
jgi:hypothetical protein